MAAPEAGGQADGDDELGIQARPSPAEDSGPAGDSPRRPARAAARDATNAFSSQKRKRPSPTKPAIRRLARRGGLKRAEGDAAASDDVRCDLGLHTVVMRRDVLDTFPMM
jgi:hypothetical protein